MRSLTRRRLLSEEERPAIAHDRWKLLPYLELRLSLQPVIAVKFSPRGLSGSPDGGRLAESPKKLATRGVRNGERASHGVRL